MDTKQRILDEALTLFSEKGYANVFVGDIAEAVGIKAPSLYKHYKSKKAIFDAIIDLQLLKLGRQFFLYFLHDDYNQKFRKMLTLEQFHDEDLARIYSRIYVDDPLSYQGMLFGFMVTSGILKTDNVQIMTLHFYAPIYYLLTICDREPDREPEMLKLLDEHIKQFDRLYGREN